jgi:hypothetical protein
MTKKSQNRVHMVVLETIRQTHCVERTAAQQHLATSDTVLRTALVQKAPCEAQYYRTSMVAEGSRQICSHSVLGLPSGLSTGKD